VSVVDLTTGEVLGVSLAENEAVIERDLKAFIRVGRALAAIRDGRQYHDNGYSDFDTYCQERWGFSRRRAGEFIEAYEVASAVGEISPTAEPARESHAAALAPLRGDPEAMAEVMAEVTAEGKVTAEKITEKVTERLTANMHPGEADAVADELGDGASPADIAEGMAEAIESREPAPITKPDLGGGVSHPARYSTNLIPIFADILDGYDHVLDPFAGTGRIHELPMHTVGVEIEPEWAALHPDTVEGSALDLPWEDAEFDAVCTSPTYGNRLADSHNASDPERRRSYTHDLGRKLSADNSGAMQWGDEYREFHETAWAEAVRVLRHGGRFVLNIKDHIRGGQRQYVTDWHVGVLRDLGLRYAFALTVDTRHLRQGDNAEARVEGEQVIVFDKAVAL
jgi:SAM-dependent methyltransferase